MRGPGQAHLLASVGKNLSLCSALGNTFTQVAKLKTSSFTPAGHMKGSATAFMVLFHLCPQYMDTWLCLKL